MRYFCDALIFIAFAPRPAITDVAANYLPITASPQNDGALRVGTLQHMLEFATPGRCIC